MSVLTKNEREALNDVFSSIYVYENSFVRLKKILKRKINNLKFFITPKKRTPLI